MDQSHFGFLSSLPKRSDEEKHRHILDGLADVDAGRTVPHEQVTSWARSLALRAVASRDEE